LAIPVADFSRSDIRVQFKNGIEILHVEWKSVRKAFPASFSSELSRAAGGGLSR